MNRIVIAVLALFLLVGAGCKHNDKGGAMKAGESGDACAMCPGVQQATADGKCPECGMKVSQDDCPHCPGVQKATADGKCPVCGMKL